MIRKEQYTEIMEMLESKKFTQAQIAEECGVSIATVKRLAKDLKENGPVANANETNNRYEQYITKEEKVYTRKYKNIQDYEDKAEGWIFHLDDLRAYKKERGCWWWGIVYPESAPKTWKEMLAATACEVRISPLHDKDLWDHDSPAVVNEETGEIIEEEGARYKCGTRKKAHYHFIIKTQQAISFTEVNNWIRRITNGPYLQKCKSLSGACKYLTHRSEDAIKAGKYQYELDEVESYNDFRIEANKAERGIMQNEICNYIVEHPDICSMRDLVIAFRDRVEYINVISTKAYIITQLINDNWRRANPGHDIKKVTIVKAIKNKERE